MKCGTCGGGGGGGATPDLVLAHAPFDPSSIPGGGGGTTRRMFQVWCGIDNDVRECEGGGLGNLLTKGMF